MVSQVVWRLIVDFCFMHCEIKSFNWSVYHHYFDVNLHAVEVHQLLPQEQTSCTDLAQLSLMTICTDFVRFWIAKPSSGDVRNILLATLGNTCCTSPSDWNSSVPSFRCSSPLSLSCVANRVQQWASFASSCYRGYDSLDTKLPLLHLNWHSYTLSMWSYTTFEMMI